ncbi:MAG: phosphatidate cytidylyltransferase [Oscillospiraceae bacterium]
MTTRIISAAVALVIAVVVLILHNTFVLPLAVGALAAIAVFEMFRAMKLNEHKPQMYIAIGYTLLSCMSYIWLNHGVLVWLNNNLFFAALLISMSILFLIEHESLKAVDFFAMLAIPYIINFSFSTLLYMNSVKVGGMFMIIVTLCGSWLADSGAYFAGTFFGKTPLCPKISPKKTVEGVIGGVVTNGVLFLIIGLVYEYLLDGAPLHYVFMILSGMICAVIGLVGDLTASVIKRQYGIKDYGNIMPGHGGVMDRFDSFMFVAPFMYFVFSQGWII